MSVLHGWRDSYRVFLVLNLVADLVTSLVATTAAIYRLEDAHLNPLQLVLVGTVLEASYFVFQIPTGLLADAYSRRRSVIAGIMLLGVSYAFEGAIAVFVTIAVAQIVRALGHALIAGALEAWVADEFGEEQLGHALLRGQQLSLVGTLLGTAAAGLLSAVALRLPLLVGAVLMVLLGVFLMAVMQETNFAGRRAAADADDAETVRKPIRTMFLEQARDTRTGLRILVNARPVILAVLAVVALYGASSEGFDRLWQAHFVEHYTFPSLGGLKPVAWFSIMGVAAALLGLVVTEIVRRRGDLTRTRALVGVLAVISAALSASMVAFALVGQFWLAVGTYLTTAALRKAYGPVVNAWMARQVEPSRRATLLSVSEMADAAGQFAGGPGIGAVGVVGGLRAALATAGLVVAPTVAMLLAARRGADQTEEPEHQEAAEALA